MKYVSAEEYCERRVKTEDCAREEERERRKKTQGVGRNEKKKCITKQLIRFLVFSVSVIYIISKTLRNAMEAGFILCAFFP